eukprot:Blabericola_migrator_1__8731@NODE_45_length_16846_cov_82_345015_g41_i0_p14_GENE_NODE_45_length_16846_cov_82_345015_g41_i0NODE_45_length_16846_cov_82_345015_g41_i0_p14_ORF_typecomplete_len133_score11_43_NODE_45_length_16846_cov_82_345015_g41_i075057903
MRDRISCSSRELALQKETALKDVQQCSVSMTSASCSFTACRTTNSKLCDHNNDFISTPTIVGSCPIRRLLRSRSSHKEGKTPLTLHTAVSTQVRVVWIWIDRGLPLSIIALKHLSGNILAPGFQTSGREGTR